MKTLTYLTLSLSLLAPQQLFCKTQEKKASVVTSYRKQVGVFAAVSLVVAAAAWKLSQSDKVQQGIVAITNDSDSEGDPGEEQTQETGAPEAVDLEDGTWAQPVSSPAGSDDEEQDSDHDALQPQPEATGHPADHDADDEKSDTGSVKTAKTDQEELSGKVASDDEGFFGSLFDQF